MITEEAGIWQPSSRRSESFCVGLGGTSDSFKLHHLIGLTATL